MLDQRVAWPRRQHNVARVAKKLEQQRVSLARAGGQDDSLRRYPRMALEVVCDCLARRHEPERFRFITQRSLVCHRSEEVAGIGKASARRIRDGEIEDLEACGAAPFDRQRKPVTSSRLP